MADVRPLRALRYDHAVAGPLAELVGPPYDVVDRAERNALAARSPYHAVHLDLPSSYAHAAELLQQWQRDGVLQRDDEPAVYVVEQRFEGRTRRGLLANVRIEPGRIHPHERTHPEAIDDRLDLTRATRANLSPVFLVHEGDALGALDLPDAPVAATEDLTLWRVAHAQPALDVLRDQDLLIADGHHRFETARRYAEERGGDGPHRFVLACLVSLEDPGLAVLPTHRLVTVDTPGKQEALAQTLREHFVIERVALADLAPPAGGGPAQFGYVDAHFRTGFRLTLKDPAGHDEVDAAVLEELVLRGPLGLTEEDLRHRRGLAYARSDDEARDRVLDGTHDAAFLLRPAPVEQVLRVARAGRTMPAKSTSFVPKVPTGLLFGPLS